MTISTEVQTLLAFASTTLRATLGPTRPLRYAHGANPVEDLPAHVRAASSIRRQGERLIIAQHVVIDMDRGEEAAQIAELSVSEH